MRVLSRIKGWVLYLMAPVAPGLCSRFLYRRAFSRPLDLVHPRTLNEKIMWLKLNTYRDDPLVGRCADKYLVREYVEQAGYSATLNDLYGVWDRAEDVDLSALPSRFVLKCTNASGYNWLCPDKALLDEGACVREMKRWLERPFWRVNSELHYRNSPSRIICEKFLWDGAIPIDYKFYCFHGKPMYVMVCVGREQTRPKFYFFDCGWNFCPITKDGQREGNNFTLPKPDCFDEMVACAEKLSAPFPFVRVDLYEDNGQIIFGELTFTPSAGLDTGRLPETDLLFGSLVKLPTDQEG